MKKVKSPLSSAELLRRWISGAARLADERRLDQAAGEDPFLNEALQGYRRHAAEDHAEALQRLHRRYPQQNRRSATLLYLVRYAAVAAAVALAVVLWRFIDTRIAQPPATLSESRQDTPPVSPGLTETPAAVPDMTAPPPAARPEKPARSLPGNGASAARNLPATAQTAEEDTGPAETLAIADDAATGAEAAPLLPVTATATEMATQEEESVVETKAFESAKPTIDSDKKAAPAAGNFLPKNKRAAAEIKDKTTAATPEGGFDAMKKYVRDNLRYPEQARLNGISGEVVLQFTVLDNGNVDQIKVVKGLPFGCNEEAIRLLKEGPKWRSENGPVWTSYTFQFKN